MTPVLCMMINVPDDGRVDLDDLAEALDTKRQVTISFGVRASQQYTGTFVGAKQVEEAGVRA